MSVPDWLSDGLAALMQPMSLFESVAVVLAVVYLVLAVRQNIWCWLAAFISTAMFFYVFFEARLYMETALQVFYMVMAVYGWRQWRGGGGGGRAGRVVIRWDWSSHVGAITLVLLLSLISSQVLGRYTDAALPLLDSLTTWGGVVATFMVARKVLENWLYWFVIDSLSIYLYISRELYQTAALFAVYLVLIVIGYRSWVASMRRNAAASASAS